VDASGNGKHQEKTVFGCGIGIGGGISGNVANHYATRGCGRDIDAFEPHSPLVDQFRGSAPDQLGFQPVHHGNKNICCHAEPNHMFSRATENVFIGQQSFQQFKSLRKGLAAKEDLHAVASDLLSMWAIRVVSSPKAGYTSGNVVESRQSQLLTPARLPIFPLGNRS
jgi:hypothetical protein